jgi:class 3 adenylate cyclase
MFSFFRRARYKLPPLSGLSLQTYWVNFSLDRLVLGVDNVRHDVYLSPTFLNATRKLVGHLVARHAGIETNETGKQKELNWPKEIDQYKQLYKEIMRDTLNQAKGRFELQIEYLAQAALIKMLLEEIRSRYDRLVSQLKKEVRLSEAATHHDSDENPKLKGRLQRVMLERQEIQQRVGMEICEFWAEVEDKEVRTMRQAVFGPKPPCFWDLLKSPIIHADQADNEIFLLVEYDLALGRRIEDPDKYRSLLFFIRQLLNSVESLDPSSKGYSVDRRLTVPKLNGEENSDTELEVYNQTIDGWVKQLGNVDRLFNWQRTRAAIQEHKKQKGDLETLANLKKRQQHQKQLLQFFYRQFCKNKLMDRITASYEMQPEYLEYCPPLTPQQIIQYLLFPKSRRVVRSRLKRMKKSYGRSFSLSPLNKKIKSIEQMTTAKRKAYLLRFISAFVRYHRDKSILDLFQDAMQRVNLAVEEKELILSRENSTLYEFLLPHEKATEVAPIINHAVVKADVRGSTDITHHMNERGLNPASYFSLNFFDPISEILSDYDASKVFIEGDAIILSIYERENTPGDWFGVARACGIALNMLGIIQRYNEKSRRNQLPILELGIGVSYRNNPPTFLFDGKNRIMISSAINQADRLSSCSKMGRQFMARKKSPFNLFVFQTVSDAVLAGTSDDLYSRYNVNGIELSPEGFEKLSKEINLKLLRNDAIKKYDQYSNLYAGLFPTKSGRFQQLVIREAQVRVVNPDTLETIRISAHKYFEICTHPALYKWAGQLTS